MVSPWVSICLSYIHSSVFFFLGDSLSKCQRIFTKLGVCIDIVKIWFGIANGQISLIFDRVICPQQVHIYNFVPGMVTSVTVSGFSLNLVRALILCSFISLYFTLLLQVKSGGIQANFDLEYLLLEGK